MAGTWDRAADHMRAALKILDETGAPEDVGAYIDLAVSRLEAEIGRRATNGSPPAHELRMVASGQTSNGTGKLAK